MSSSIITGGVQCEARDILPTHIVINVGSSGRLLWSLGGHSGGVTMVVGGTAAELTALAHRLLDFVADSDAQIKVNA